MKQILIWVVVGEHECVFVGFGKFDDHVHVEGVEPLKR